jgi:conjugative relaxase-like TrwC/TraI family protein
VPLAFSQHPTSAQALKFRLAHWHKGAILIWWRTECATKSQPLQLVSLADVVRWSPVLTISRLSRWSINYYNDTARQAAQPGLDRQRANGGLGEYYSESDTRAPTWLIAGETARTAELVGLDGRAVDGGTADPDVAQRWLDDGIAPNGAAGRAFRKGSVHGFDLTFAAPKSVSLLRALTTDVNDKAVSEAHRRAVTAAMTYLHQHAGYTRVHNPRTGMKDLQRLPGLAAVAYQHETSRCGDPHLHTHVIVPNRQARADGVLVSLDSKSLYHEAKAAGVMYQAVLRHELHAERGVEWNAVDPHTGMAEIAGITRECVTAWSRRSSRLREWARNNLVLVGGQPSAQQLAAAQKATRPAKPEAMSWAALKEQWRADARGLHLDRAAHLAARTARRAAAGAAARTVGAHGGADRQGGVHARGPRGAGRRAAADRRTGGALRSHRRACRHVRGAHQRAARRASPRRTRTVHRRSGDG